MAVKISTKNGDKGFSSLANGQKLSKKELVFDVLGSLDELNSWLGLIVSKMDQQFEQKKKFVIYFQKELFTLSAEIAQAPNIQTNKSILTRIEKESEQLEIALGNIKNKFVLPGGTQLAAYTDIARTVCRRAERNLVTLAEDRKVRPVNLKILNRFSDYLYLLRYYINFKSSFKETIINN